MQKNIARGLAIGFLALVVGLTSFSSMASASSTKTTAKTKVTRAVKVKKAKKVKATKGHKRTLPGKVLSVSETTLVMMRGNKTYTVDVTGITPVNRKGAAITLADIKVGHKVSLRGTVTGTAVTNILKLRDITLPVSVATDAD